MEQGPALMIVNRRDINATPLTFAAMIIGLDPLPSPTQ
jgi:hypothetical protein